MFEGFGREGLELLGRLPSFDTERFRSHRGVYETELRKPLIAFVVSLGPRLQDAVSPGIGFEAKTHGSIGPINNDRRFDPEKPLYKDHVLLRFWDGDGGKAAPTLFVRLTPSEVGFAAGAMFPDLDAWRRAVDRHGDSLAAELRGLRESTNADLVGQELKRVPAGYAPDHPHADLLRHKWLQARWPRPLPDVVGEPGFVDFCAGELTRAAGLHRWLVRHVG